MNPALFFEVFDGLPRQGPGELASTLRALAMVPPPARILDVGCGTGAPTLALVQHTKARVTAVDSHAPFVEALKAKGVDAQVADMNSLPFPDASFDLIWAEGAIYQMGFDAGLKAWKRLLVPGGAIAVTELSWLTETAPPECREFWARNYPAMRGVPENLEAITRAGYRELGHFTLPPSAWEEFYGPLERNLEAFRARHVGETEAAAVAAEVQQEIDMYRAHGDHYGYVFYVMAQP